MSTRRSTIDDVAVAAGVARVIVSPVLNNEQNVRPETREKVRRAVEELEKAVGRSEGARDIVTRRMASSSAVGPRGVVIDVPVSH